MKRWMKTRNESKGEKGRRRGGRNGGRKGRRDGEMNVGNALYYFAILGPPKVKGIFSVHNP